VFGVKMDEKSTKALDYIFKKYSSLVRGYLFPVNISYSMVVEIIINLKRE
jgi:hypothetical protein